MAGDVHRRGKTFLGAIRDPPMQILPRREGNGVKQEIQLAPPGPDTLEHGLELAGFEHIAMQYEWSLQRFRQRSDIWLGLRVQIGHSQFGTLGAKLRCTAIGDAVFVGDSHHKALLALQGHWRSFLPGGRINW